MIFVTVGVGLGVRGRGWPMAMGREPVRERVVT